MKIRLIPFLLFAFVLPALASGQAYSFIHYDTKDGLPSGTVYDITQDTLGFLWFGTENGLCRFDGKNFRSYTTKNGMPDNSILKVHGDRSGGVYFLPFTHPLHYIHGDSVRTLHLAPEMEVPFSNIVSIKNQGSKLIVYTTTDLFMSVRDSFVSLRKSYHLPNTPIFVKQVSDSLLLIGSSDSMYYILANGAVHSKPYGLADKSAVFDVFGVPHRLNFPAKLRELPGNYLNPEIFQVYYNDTLFLFNSATGVQLHAIRIEKFSQCFIDNENNLWISTLGNGVYRLPSFSFRTFDFGANREIFSLSVAKNSILAGSDFSTLLTIYPGSDREITRTQDLSAFVANSGNTVSQLTRRNRIYVMRTSESGDYFGTDAFLLRSQPGKPPLIKNFYPVKDIDVYQGKILICTSEKATLHRVSDLETTDTLLFRRTTCGIIYQGKYYLGTLGGLIEIDDRTRKTALLYKTYPALEGRITALARGTENDIWIATSGHGLSRFKNGKLVATLHEENGLTSDICTSIKVDDKLIWVGTNKGLNRIELPTLTVTRFTMANGLGADFINCVTATDSTVYVGTAAGLTLFGKKALAEKSVCILHLLGVSQNNRYLPLQDNYDFSHDALNIRFDFTAVSFKSAGDITYQFQLRGFDDHWNSTSANFINFTALQPGTYTLALRAINKFKVESRTLLVTINIRPPWWKSWWFYFFALAATIGLIILIYRHNIRILKRKQEIQRTLEKRFSALEQQALQAQMNPHFIFNALNSIQTYILDLDAEGANRYLTSFASLIRQTLENSLQPLITLTNELNYLETYLNLEKLRFREKFTYTISLDQSIDTGQVLLPAMLLQPYVENAIRHGIQNRPDNNGEILLTIRKNDNGSISYLIADNGVGRQRATELRSHRQLGYHSRAVSINEKRIVAINIQYSTNITVVNEDILDAEGAVAGTSVHVNIPTIQNQEKHDTGSHH